MVSESIINKSLELMNNCKIAMVVSNKEDESQIDSPSFIIYYILLSF